MKQQSLLLILFLLGFGACKKPDNTPTESNTNKPVLEFVYFKVTGGEYNNKWIKFEKNETLHSFCSRSVSFISFGMSSSQFGASSTQFRIAASSEGVYDVDQFSNSGISLNILSNSGIIQLTCVSAKVIFNHLPLKSTDYVVGTFSGVFYQSFSPTDTFTISEGSFRIKSQ
jgi:hypothetical protein